MVIVSVPTMLSQSLITFVDNALLVQLLIHKPTLVNVEMVSITISEPINVCPSVEPMKCITMDVFVSIMLSSIMDFAGSVPLAQASTKHSMLVFALSLKSMMLSIIGAIIFNALSTRFFLETDVSVLQDLSSPMESVDNAQLLLELTRTPTLVFVLMALISTHLGTCV